MGVLTHHLSFRRPRASQGKVVLSFREVPPQRNDEESII